MDYYVVKRVVATARTQVVRSGRIGGCWDKLDVAVFVPVQQGVSFLR
jgi:hypothetical protein